MGIPFDNTYAKLPARFYAVQTPTPVAAPGLIRVNYALAEHLGIDPRWLESAQGIEVLAGNAVPDRAAPISQAYAGHQFANFVPQLGDGRAILLGEVIASNGQRYDIQLKGSGPTPFSRRGDGRSALGPVLREYIVSEAMHALGVPTTRALAAVTSGETVYRGDLQAGGVFTRIARSHLRVGTFQYFAALQDHEALRMLADMAIARHYPEAAEAAVPALALLDGVIASQARLICHWLGFGFIHGVMNTDNCAISGETIDYGPCAFMEQFHPQCVFSSIDQQGRYAWGNQAQIAYWNLTRFAETLLPLIHDDQDQAIKQAEQSLDAFPSVFESVYRDTFAAKLGLVPQQPGNPGLIKHTLEQLAEQQIDFTVFVDSPVSHRAMIPRSLSHFGKLKQQDATGYKLGTISHSPRHNFPPCSERTPFVSPATIRSSVRSRLAMPVILAPSTASSMALVSRLRTNPNMPISRRPPLRRNALRKPFAEPKPIGFETGFR